MRKSHHLKPWAIISGIFIVIAVIVILILLNKNDGVVDTRVEAVSTGSGETVITYHDKNGIHAQKIDLSGRNLWGDTGIVVLPQIPEQDYTIYPDSLGGAIILSGVPDMSGQYSSWPKILVPSSVSVQRLNANGELLWRQGISFGTTRPVSACVVPDEDGGAILAWNEYIPSRQPDEPVLRVNKLDLDGNLLWGNQGVTIAESADRKFPLYSGKYVIISDGEQGIYVFWEISSGTNQYVTYAQRLDSNGSIIWPENIIIAKNKLRTAESDGAGGAFVQSVELTGAFVNPSVFTQINKTGEIIAEHVSLTGGILLRDGFDGYFEIVENYFAPSGVSMSEADVTLDVRHLDGEVNVLWSKTDIIDPGKGNRINSKCFIDETGGLHIVWQKIDKNNTNPGEILITHLSEDGIPYQDLKQDGTEYPVFSGQGGYLITAFSDDEGGAIIISHMLPGLFKKSIICTQRINSEGTMLWEQRINIDN